MKQWYGWEEQINDEPKAKAIERLMDAVKIREWCKKTNKLVFESYLEFIEDGEVK
jgi:hypothetical protein